ncbi:MAG: ThuA domain-containing protein [Clostridia bacterium]|nr:ThuA domain-containing protein [Clostridia bacterium]
MMEKIRVTIWNEFRHEKTKENVKALYPNGLHALIGEFLSETGDMEITLAALDDPDQGLPESVLENTDVLLWWGHMAHHEVDDALVRRIQARVYEGKMGFIALHSGHHSKPFRAIVGTNGNLSWGRNQKEIVWNMMPSHPIAAGIPDHFLLEEEELYSEPFYIPQPDALVFGSWFEDGHIFRSGACFIRGAGKVFYFQPGHESCPSFYNPYVRRIITNAVYWANPGEIGYEIPNGCPHIKSAVIEEFGGK